MILTIFLVGLFILLALLTIFRNIIIFFLGSLFSIFRKGKKGAGSASAYEKKTDSASWSAGTGPDGGTVRRKKMISDSDGEYVDYEEVRK